MKYSLGARFSGVTLMELVLTIVILSIAMLAVVSVYSKAISRSADPLIYAKSVELAQTYLDEILTKKYDHNTPTGGVPPAGTPGNPLAGIGEEGSESNRDDYNDVDDYHNQTYNVQQFITGGGFNQYASFTVSITVSYAGTEVGVTNDQVKRIDVTVTNPLNNSLTFSAYKGNY